VAKRLEELNGKIDPEPKPVRHLREYSNYLSPRLGLLSGDTWTMVALYVRNVLLNLLVLVPILAALLALPRLFAYLAVETSSIMDVGYAWAAVFFLTWAFGYVGFKRPVDGPRAPHVPAKRGADASYLLSCALPLTLAAVAVALFWADVNSGEEKLDGRWTVMAGIGALAAMTLLPFAIYYARVARGFFQSSRTTHASFSSQILHLAIKGFQEMLGTIAGLLTAVVLFVLLALKVFPHPMQSLWPLINAAHLPPALRASISMMPVAALYICFAVPAIMFVFFVQATIFVGISSHRNEDNDREWWGRAGAWGLVIGAAWAVVSGIALFGPIAIYHAPVLLSSIGGLAGVAAAVLGFSAKTPANKRQKEEDKGVGGKIGNLALTLAVPLFVMFLLASISLGTTWLTYQARPMVTHEPKIEWSQYRQQAQLSSQLHVKTVLPDTLAAQTPALRSRAGTAGAEVPPIVTTEVRDQSPVQPRISLPLIQAIAHLQTVQHTNWKQLLGFLAVGAVGFALSFCIGVNKFSMQALYRNRIVRAYLGASRYRRDPDKFTGFDENDNLAMHQMRPELLWPSSVRDAKQLIDALREASTNGVGDLKGLLLQRRILAQHLWTRFYQKTRLQIGDHVTSGMIDTVVQNLNVLIANEATRFEDVPNLQLPADFWATPKKDEHGKPLPLVKYPVVMRNRAVLDYCFQDILTPMPLPREAAKRDDAPTKATRPPLHVVNVALNLVSGEKLAWQQRKAESFTFSPYQSGSIYLGYRPSQEYGGADGVSVGTAVTISGAAASPNMGYHSSPALAFLLTLFNIRLGWWLGNPGPVGQKVYRQSHPGSNLSPMLAEATGRTNDGYDWVYLSDGGHFENLGLYEMVLRRSHYIVLSDAGADPTSHSTTSATRFGRSAPTSASRSTSSTCSCSRAPPTGRTARDVTSPRRRFVTRRRRREGEERRS
jgi:hypothetical protein